MVKSAFEQPIESANVSLALSTQTGMKLTLAGPYKSNGKGELPSADMRLKFQGPGLPSIEGRLISTGTNAFVEYGGETYEVGENEIAELKKQGAGDAPTQMSASDIEKLMGTMQDWFPQSDAQEDAELDGEPVTRVTGELDLSAALTDLKELAKKPGISSAEGIKELSNGDIKRVERMVRDPRFTIDVGRSDGKLRRIVASIKMADDSDKIDFSIQFKDVDKPVTIDAPSSGKPIEELGKKLEQEFGGGATNPDAVQG